jgi:ABC transport system ATP-binding/permease protein
MYKLVIQDDEGKTTVVPLIRDELTIGRKEGNTIRLTERNVSRRHARLVRQNGSISIEDLGSYNGIRVNGTRIQGRASIKETDRVQIGDYLIEIKSEANDKVETLNGRTQPLPRADQPGAPEAVAAMDTASQATNRIAAKADAPVVVYPPTEQMMALAETDPGLKPSGVQHGRLVVLSTLFAGQEFELDKPAIVIGRTDENDVSLNHRSISRHHAKIVRENGRYAVVDLQSSNGVRVNGEEYGKVELRRGDVIDLGHVRLRFVEPGEDFLFGRDAQAVDTDAGGGSKAALWIALGLLVVGAIVAVILFKDGGSDTGQATAGPSTVSQGAAPPRAPDPTGAPDPSHGAAVPPAAIDAGSAALSSDEVGKHVELSRQAIGSERWQLALDEAKAALLIDPQSKEAKALADQARAELAQEKIYSDFLRAGAAKQLARSADLFRKLDPDSVYKVKAQPEHDRLRAEYIKVQGEAGRRLAERGKCRDQRKLAVDAERVWGAEVREAVLATTCKEAVASNPNPGGSGDGGGTPPDSGTPPDTGPSADDLLAEAKQAAKEDQFGKALRLCQAALTKRPGDSEAAQICVIAACNLRNAATAKKYMDKVKSTSRVQALKQICATKGVDLN